MKRAQGTLARQYRNIDPRYWEDENHFIGTIDRINWRTGETVATISCYGWSKGAGFFIYEIIDGHIAKLGSVPRDTLLDK